MKGYFSILLFKMHFCKLKVCKVPWGGSFNLLEILCIILRFILVVSIIFITFAA